MNKIVFILLFFPILLCSQNHNLKDKKYYYKDQVVSIELWYGDDKVIDSIKTYHNNGSKNEMFYFDSKGLMDSNAFQYNEEGEKLVTWNFSHGKLVSRIDHKLPYNKDSEESLKNVIKYLTELNIKTNYNPKNINDLYRRGSLRSKLGNNYLALLDFKRVDHVLNIISKDTTKIIPDSIKSRNERFKSVFYDNMANIYVDFEMENYALQYFYKAMAAAPNDYRILYNFASYLQQKKSFELAQFYLEKIIKEKPEHAHARWGLARLYSDIGEYDKAMENINYAFKYEKVIIERTNGYGSRDLRTTRGLLYHKLGESEKGIQDLKEALAMNKNNSYAMKNLGIIYLDQKKYDEACQLFEKAKSLKYTLVYDENDLDALIEKACNNVEPEIVITKPKPFVFPNPVTTVISIQNYDYKIFEFEFFDFESNSVLRGKSFDGTIDVTRLNTAFYILKLFNTDSPQTFKIIKE